MGLHLVNDVFVMHHGVQKIRSHIPLCAISKRSAFFKMLVAASGRPIIDATAKTNFEFVKADTKLSNEKFFLLKNLQDEGVSQCLDLKNYQSQYLLSKFSSAASRFSEGPRPFKR